MERAKLQLRPREDMSRHHLKEMRRQGWIPASLYGKTKDTNLFEVRVRDLAEALKTEAGIHAIFELSVEGGKKSETSTAVVKNIQKDPLTRMLLYVDFERVSLQDVITTSVPVELTGEAPGVREGGILEQVMNEMEVKCRANRIPTRVEVDVTGLDIGDSIHASSLTLPQGVELASRPDDTVVTLRPPHVRAAPTPEAAEEEEEEETAPAGAASTQET